jgi:hypothetical protein
VCEKIEHMYDKPSPGHHERLLVNYWYAYPIGHAIEALRYCLGYHSADPNLSVNLLLSAATPVELANYVDFIDRTYGVPYRDFVEPDGDPILALRDVPREWDWVVDNHRACEKGHNGIRGFRVFFDAANKHFIAKKGRGVAGAGPPPYEPHHQLTLELPAKTRAAAEARLMGRMAISVVLAGSSAEREQYPSVSSWRLVLGALAERFPEAVFCLIGKSNQKTTLSISGIGGSEVDRIAEGIPAIDCFDLPLAEQLAIIEAAQLHVSPHTGFSFSAFTVGTPWLAISGGRWHEYFFNGVPFHSVLPDPNRYPTFAWADPLPLIADTDGEGQRTPTMSRARIEEDLPEIIDAAGKLIANQIHYEAALADYFPRLLRAHHGDRSRIFSFDNIHKDYL